MGVFLKFFLSNVMTLSSSVVVNVGEIVCVGVWGGVVLVVVVLMGMSIAGDWASSCCFRS